MVLTTSFSGCAIDYNDSIDNQNDLMSIFSGSAFKFEEDPKGGDFSGSVVAVKGGTPWILDSGSSRSISADLAIFEEYHDWKPGEKPYCYGSSIGLSGTTKGWGYAKLVFDTGFELHFKCYYNPATPLSMLSVDQLHKTFTIGWDSPVHTLYKIKNWETISYTHSKCGVFMLQLQ